MSETRETRGNPPRAGVGRRMVIGGLVSASTAALIPWALAQEVADDAEGAFLAISAILVGDTILDAGLAKRLHDALVADDPDFPAGSKALLEMINEQSIDPMRLQQVLDDQKSPLATIPRRIAGGWFLGIVGSGDKARCIAFEEALNARIVSDVLRPPTYAYGPYGSWTRKPT